jgi:diamine N-acetyltransferase
VDHFSIRPATLDDASALSALGQTAFRETFHHYEEAALSEFLDSHCGVSAFIETLSNLDISILVAVADNQLVGYAKYGESRLPKSSGLNPKFELHQLYVLKAWHGYKIGKTLIEEVMQAGRKERVKIMHLGVWEHNKKAQDFYARLGFEKVGEYDYLPIGKVIDHEWIMAKSLEN